MIKCQYQNQQGTFQRHNNHLNNYYQKYHNPNNYYNSNKIMYLLQVM